MAKSIFAIFTVALLSTQVTFASCETSTIPGYFKDRYVDNNDGTILDNMTNLMWMKCDIDIPWDPIIGACQDKSNLPGPESRRIKYTWQDALIQARDANNIFSSGRNDWRLPNVKELSSILALHCASSSNATALNTDYFDGTAANYWSSTPNREPSKSVELTPPVNNAWKISFKADSNVGAGFSAIDQKHNVRLVRDNTQ